MFSKGIHTALRAGAAAAALLFSAACQREIIGEPGRRLFLEPSVVLTAETKATVTGTVFPQSRDISASAWLSGQDGGRFFGDSPFAWDGAHWSSDRYWPVEGTLDLYALSTDGLSVSLSSISESGATYTLPDNSSHQADILYATAPAQEYAEAVPMSFRHASAALVFTAQCTEDFDEDADRGIEITGITVEGLRWSGTLSLSSGGELATSLSTTSNDTDVPGLSGLSSYNVPAQAMDHTRTENYFGIGGRGLLVPRQEKRPFTVSFNVHDGNGSVTPMSQSFTPGEGVWENGCKYAYILKFDGTQLLVEPSLPVDFDVVVTEWSNGGNREAVIFPGGTEVVRTLSTDRTEIYFDCEGNPEGTGTVMVSSYRTAGSTFTPAGWETQVHDGSGWVPLSEAVTDPQYAWLSALPAGNPSPTELYTDVSVTLPATGVVSHEEMLRSGTVLPQDGTSPVDNSTLAGAVDLSRYDFASRRLEAQRYTANCYVVSAPGWYKFPLVYGNAIENDAAVSLSYDPTSVGAGHLDGFKNYKYDLIIASPWIEQDWHTWLVRRNSVASLKLLWEQYSHYDETTDTVTEQTSGMSAAPTGVIDGLQIVSGDDGRYVAFHIGPENIRPGNFLIGALDAGGDSSDEEGETGALVMWSWHIWITDQPMETVTVNNGSTDYAVLPVNTGWTDGTKGQYHPERSARIRFVSTQGDGTASEVLTVTQRDRWDESLIGWGPYYQWGRKDPFVRGIYTYKENYDMNMRGSIRHPDWFNTEQSTYFGTPYWDWIVNNYDNLWDSQWNSYGVTSGALPNHKTVMDPSPRRFCVSPDTAWDGFVTNGHEGDYSGGYHFLSGVDGKTIFFPAAGFIDHLGQHNSTENRYWTLHAWASMQRRASYGLRFTESEVNSCFYTGNYRATGQPVRSVRFN